MKAGIVEACLALLFIATAIANNDAWLDWLAMAGFVALLAIATVKAWMHDRKQETKVPTVGRKGYTSSRTNGGTARFRRLSDEPTQEDCETAWRIIRREGKEV